MLDVKQNRAAGGYEEAGENGQGLRGVVRYDVTRHVLRQRQIKMSHEHVLMCHTSQASTATASRQITTLYSPVVYPEPMS